ncbi:MULTISPECIES: MFS transporter [unclassified Bradyrhizobium]|uniref:MFS transporter n=1 Tax=unclassified Bradyrhizobium TaxID=2631580 RepID=UPI0024794272|nr:MULTISPECIES: MFS transporter [unclassified Bradyrhizobium]WGS17768.1 MFS transporter [Bradyrhizobium sp. ISRA463]WGS24563.1 MFS transporter [Bradyrhizobium sp. ISRA464]
MTTETADTLRFNHTGHAMGDPRRWLALPVLLTGAFLPILDFNVVNLALPAIRQDLGATASEVQFVISAYAATYAVFLITGGRLGDLCGRRRMFLGGVAGFTIASVLCGIAWSPAVLVAGRILQGLTATAMAPQVLASIRVLFPAAEQGHALGYYGATFGLANICGQVLGGVLVSAHPFGLAWQAIFLINVPIGLAAFIGGLLFLTDSRAEHAQRIDIGGVILLSLTLGLLVYPLIQGRETGWPVWIIAMLLASPLMLAVFVRFEANLSARGGDPLVALHLLRNSDFVIGLVMALAFYMLSSFYLTFAVYLQNGLHESPLTAGLATLPFAVGFFMASLVSSYVMQWLGVRTLTLGFALQVVGFGVVMLSVGGVLSQSLAIGLVCGGLGFGTVMPSVIKAVIGSIDPRHAGLASGMMISTFQIGAALGVAIIGGVFYSLLGPHPDADDYAHAFTIALGCNVALLALGGWLSLWLPREQAA